MSVQEKIERITTKSYPNVKIQKSASALLAKLLGNFRSHFKGAQSTKDLIKDLSFINAQSANLIKKLTSLIRKNSDKDVRSIVAIVTTTMLHTLLDLIVFYMEGSGGNIITTKIIKEVFEVDSVFTNLFGDHTLKSHPSHSQTKKYSGTPKSALTVAKLRKMASDKNITGRSKMNKAELVKALKL